LEPVVGVRPEKREEYLALHRAVWPGVVQKMTECGIRNYSIFISGDTLFAYYEYIGEDRDADMQRIADDPVSQEWWTHTDPCHVRIVEERGYRPGPDGFSNRVSSGDSACAARSYLAHDATVSLLAVLPS
jgi:L-rhamnose mutarotase